MLLSRPMLGLSARQKLYVVLCSIFLTALLIANCVAGKFFTVGGFTMSVGVIPFPITFLLTDIVNEYYGNKGARFITYIGMVMMLFANGLIYLAMVLPISELSPVTEESFENVFGLSWRLFLGSLIAYLLGQVSDIQSFSLLKRFTGERLIWLRATGSTALSQVIDTVVVTTVIFADSKSVEEITRLCATGYGYKMLVAVGMSPLLYVAHGVITRRLGIRAEAPGAAP